MEESFYMLGEYACSFCGDYHTPYTRKPNGRFACLQCKMCCCTTFIPAEPGKNLIPANLDLTNNFIKKHLITYPTEPIGKYTGPTICLYCHNDLDKDAIKKTKSRKHKKNRKINYYWKCEKCGCRGYIRPFSVPVWRAISQEIYIKKRPHEMKGKRKVNER